MQVWEGGQAGELGRCLWKSCFPRWEAKENGGQGSETGRTQKGGLSRAQRTGGSKAAVSNLWRPWATHKNTLTLRIAEGLQKVRASLSSCFKKDYELVWGHMQLIGHRSDGLALKENPSKAGKDTLRGPNPRVPAFSAT